MSGLLGRQRGVLVLIWTAMMVSLGVYLVVSRLAAPESPALSDAPALLLRTVFWVLVVIETLFLMWWRERHLNPEKAMIQPGVPISAALSSMTTKRILAFAIAESFAVYGLVLALVAGALWDQILFTLVSAVLMVQLYPSVRLFDPLERACANRA